MAAMADASAAAVSKESVKTGSRSIERHQFERNLLRHGHHHLLKLGFGSEADQPDFAPRRIARQVGRFEEGMAGPRVQDGRQHHFILEGRPAGPMTGSRVCSGSGTMLPQTAIWNGVLMGALKSLIH